MRAELAKGVDSAALVAAKNISNPFVTPTTLAEEFGRENFEAGYVGTPQSGAGSFRFNATMVESDKVSVTGNVNATATLARLFGINTIPVAATAVAQKKEVEIMMILDRSGSMAGAKMTALKNAAKGFLDFFADTQDKDKVGISSPPPPARTASRRGPGEQLIFTHEDRDQRDDCQWCHKYRGSH